MIYVIWAESFHIWPPQQPPLPELGKDLLASDQVLTTPSGGLDGLTHDGIGKPQFCRARPHGTLQGAIGAIKHIEAASSSSFGPLT